MPPGPSIMDRRKVPIGLSSSGDPATWAEEARLMIELILGRTDE
jgi:hypothetical protein